MDNIRWEKYPLDDILGLDVFVSENGDIKCNDIIRKMSIGKNGYKYLTFKKKGEYKTKNSHRLVCETFCKRADESYNVVNHIDGNKLNNHYTNLEWTNHSKNNQHAFDMGLKFATYNKRNVRLWHTKTGKVMEFDSIRDCALYINSKNIDGIERKLANTEAGLTKLLNGRLKTYLKYKLEYIDGK